MALVKPFDNNEYRRFESDLLSVLQNDSKHKLDFDGKMLFKSRRLNCVMAATDVHLDKETGNVILVGAFRQGTPVIDETKNYLSFKKMISVPLKEVYEDLYHEGQQQSRLVSKARKAAIDKYVAESCNRFKARGMFEDGILDLTGGFDLPAFITGGDHVSSILDKGEGKFALALSNEYDPCFLQEVSSLSLRDVQLLGRQLDVLSEKVRLATEVYSNKMKELRPGSRTYTSAEDLRDQSAALVHVYEKGFPPRIVDAVAVGMTGKSFFSGTRAEIDAMVEDFRKTGILEPEKARAERNVKGQKGPHM